MLTAAQRARTERNRLRARALHDARLVTRTARHAPAALARSHADTGGGFLPEAEEPSDAGAHSAASITQPAAPIVHPSEQPRCIECGLPFPQSYLFDTFEHRVCDECRDDGEKHALITRTEAKSEYLLKDCDLDSRPPPLRCVRRRNPHSSRYGDMRLYLRAQVEERALEVWGGAERIEAERARREEGRLKVKHKRAQKRMRALRMDVRSSLYERSHASHQHAFGPERPLRPQQPQHQQSDSDTDTYCRECTTCGYIETYEKI